MPGQGSRCESMDAAFLLRSHLQGNREVLPVPVAAGSFPAGSGQPPGRPAGQGRCRCVPAPWRWRSVSEFVLESALASAADTPRPTGRSSGSMRSSGRPSWRPWMPHLRCIRGWRGCCANQRCSNRDPSVAPGARLSDRTAPGRPCRGCFDCSVRRIASAPA